jgi:membrane-associated phospholipid phosphatase
MLVGPFRVYLDGHWPGDVVVAYLLASLWLVGTVEAHLFLTPCLDITHVQH